MEIDHKLDPLDGGEVTVVAVGSTSPLKLRTEIVCRSTVLQSIVLEAVDTSINVIADVLDAWLQGLEILGLYIYSDLCSGTFPLPEVTSEPCSGIRTTDVVMLTLAIEQLLIVKDHLLLRRL